MQWELVLTWLGLLTTIGTGVYKMGQQSQKIESHQTQINKLENQLEASQEIPIKLATLESDVKYLIREFTEIKSYIMQGHK